MNDEVHQEGRRVWFCHIFPGMAWKEMCEKFKMESDMIKFTVLFFSNNV